MASAPPLTSPALLAVLFRGVSDPARLSCLLAVRDGPRTVGEIVTVTGLSQPNASKHLACLRECGLVHAERDGRFVRYSLSCEGVGRLLYAAEDLFEAVGANASTCPTYGEWGSHGD